MRLVSDLEIWAGRREAGKAVNKDNATRTLIAFPCPPEAPTAAPPSRPPVLLKRPWIRFSIEEIGKKIDQHETRLRNRDWKRRIVRGFDSAASGGVPRGVRPCPPYWKDRPGRSALEGGIQCPEEARTHLARRTGRPSWNFSLDRRWNV